MGHATRGAACTVLLATDLIDSDADLLIVGLNEYVETDLMAVVQTFRERGLDAGTLVFESVHPRYSYVRLGEDGLVLEAAQGRPIPPLSIPLPRMNSVSLGRWPRGP